MSAFEHTFENKASGSPSLSAAFSTQIAPTAGERTEALASSLGPAQVAVAQHFGQLALGNAEPAEASAKPAQVQLARNDDSAGELYNAMKRFQIMVPYLEGHKLPIFDGDTNAIKVVKPLE